MNWEALESELTPHGLFLMGALHDSGDTVALIGASSGMWSVFQSSSEFSDGKPDPLDRWSKQVIGALADQHTAKTSYPSDGPPYPPFIAWAKTTGQFWQSPTGMLVHDVAGLMISIRGALIWDRLHDLPEVTASNPCENCIERPCASACPVGALSAHTQYDVPLCKDFLRSPDGRGCMGSGCFVRRTCPVSQSFGRDPEQSAFHMRAFLPV